MDQRKEDIMKSQTPIEVMIIFYLAKETQAIMKDTMLDRSMMKHKRMITNSMMQTNKNMLGIRMMMMEKIYWKTWIKTTCTDLNSINMKLKVLMINFKMSYLLKVDRLQMNNQNNKIDIEPVVEDQMHL